MSILNKINVKNVLVRDKLFLKSLYEGDTQKNKKILSVANDTELDTLLKYLHFLSNGEIDITKENFEKIQATKKLQILRKKVEKKIQVLRVIKSARSEKLKFLNIFQHIYPFLLYSLFNET